MKVKTKNKIEGITLSNVDIEILNFKNESGSSERGDFSWKSVEFKLDGATLEGTSKSDVDLKLGKAKMDLEILPTKASTLKFKLAHGEPKTLAGS